MKEGVCLSVSVLNLKLKLIIQQVEQVFLAAKRSSTPALVLCPSVHPSVCPWSKLNFSLFGQLITTYDSL